MMIRVQYVVRSALMVMLIIGVLMYVVSVATLRAFMRNVAALPAMLMRYLKR